MPAIDAAMHNCRKEDQQRQQAQCRAALADGIDGAWCKSVETIWREGSAPAGMPQAV